MSESNQSKPSFSSGRRWVFRLNFVLGIIAITALLVMVNYLASGYYKRFQVDAFGAARLSPLTVRTLELVTNKVEITVFCDPAKDLYALSTDLLKEYQNANPKFISVRTLDYTRFNGEARKLLERLNLSVLADRDFVVFECNGHSKVCYANSLLSWDINTALTTRELRRSEFRGELLFTSAINSVVNPQTVKTYFLSGHGECDPANKGEEGYSKLAGILTNELNFANYQSLSLQGSNGVPADCQLLIVAGPSKARLMTNELERIDAYLQLGGRMLLLLDGKFTNSGAETLLSRWGVDTVDDSVVEMDKQFVNYGNGFLASVVFHHPIMDAIKAEGNMSILFNAPRPFIVRERATAPGEPNVSLLAASSDKSVLSRQPARPGVATNLMVAIEKDVIKGIKTSGTRVVAIGDSTVLDNNRIDLGAGNHFFAWLAMNWLLERPDVLLANLPPRPIRGYKLMLTESQFGNLDMLFLIGLPGLVFAIGGLVWLRRRR